MKAFLRILILIFVSKLSFSQKNNFEATYKIKYKKVNFDSVKKQNNNTQNTRYNKNLVNIEKQLNEESNSFNKLTFSLEFNNSESKFYKLPIMKNEAQKMQLITILFGVLEQKYFANSDRIIVEKNSFGQDFLVEMPKIDWEISNEEKKIGKYICYKATTKIKKENTNGSFYLNVTAWFTPELSFNFGPKIYTGLPGLIIRLEEGKNIIYYLDKLEKKKYRKIRFPTKGKRLSAKEFDALSKKMFEGLKN